MPGSWPIIYRLPCVQHAPRCWQSYHTKMKWEIPYSQPPQCHRTSSFLGLCPFPVILENNISKLRFSSWINEPKNVAKSWWRLRILGKGEHLKSFYSSHLGIETGFAMRLYVPFFGESWGQRAPFRGLIMIGSCECFIGGHSSPSARWNGRSFRMIVMWWLLQSSQMPQFCWWGKIAPWQKPYIWMDCWPQKRCLKIRKVPQNVTDFCDWSMGRRESHDLKKSRDQWCSLLFSAKTRMNAVKDGITKSSTIHDLF